jgi:hypothetical protein
MAIGAAETTIGPGVLSFTSSLFVVSSLSCCVCADVSVLLLLVEDGAVTGCTREGEGKLSP